MGGMRMTGLISGMDTESMVKELVSASSKKVDKVKQEKQKLQWKQEAWQGLNTKIYDFFKSEVSGLRLASTFKTKKATSGNESKVKVTAGSGAANGTHTVSVKQLASSAYLTGAKISDASKSYTTRANVSGSTNFEDMVDSTGASLGFDGTQTITIGNGNALGDLTFTLGGSGANSVANLDELNQKLQETPGFEKLSASFVDGKLAFTNTSKSKDENGVETGIEFTVRSDAFGINGTVDYHVDEDNAQANKLSGSLSAKIEKQFTGAEIGNTTKLADIGIQVGTAFKIGEKEFVVADDTTISDLTDGLSKMGVNASFDAKQGRFYINSAGTGSEFDFDIQASGNALDILGLSADSGATKIKAQDAIIDYNGVEYVGSSNTFEINGLKITATGVTGKYDATTGTFTDDSPINLEVASDTDGVYNSIKNFVKKYNELIDEMNSLYNEKKTDYEPLTDEERSKLSETQIEQWEKKAKSGLLRRDETINTLLSSMRNILNQGVTVTDKDGNQKKVTLASLGVVTGDWSENGKLHIMGDADDPAYAGQENKLKAALESNPEIFSQFFAGTDEEKGVGTQLYDSLNKAMKRSETSRSQKFYNDITLEDELSGKEDEIKKWEEKLKKMEDRWYDQFTAMEKAMAAMQQQQSYLSALMGTGA